MGVEISILNLIQSMKCSLLDSLMPLISQGVVVWFILPVILLIRKNTRTAGWILLAAIGIDILLCNGILKNAFQRVRPCDVNPAVPLLVRRPTDYSFPSGHTALSFAAVTGLWLSGVLKKWRIPALILACLIAFSRLYLYLHYPTDILVGMAVGVFCGWLAMKLLNKVSGTKQLRQALP